MNDQTIGNSIFLVVSFFATSSFLILLWLVFPTTTMAYFAFVSFVLLVGLLFFGLRRTQEKGKRSVLQEVAEKAGLVAMDESYQKVVGEYCGGEVTLSLVTKQQKSVGEEISLHYVHSVLSIENPAKLFLQLSEREDYSETAFQNENENEDHEDAQFRARFSVNCTPDRLCEALFATPDLQDRLMGYHVEELMIRENQLSFKVLSGDATYLQQLLDFLCDLRGQIDLILPQKSTPKSKK